MPTKTKNTTGVRKNTDKKQTPSKKVPAKKTTTRKTATKSPSPAKEATAKRAEKKTSAKKPVAKKTTAVKKTSSEKTATTKKITTSTEPVKKSPVKKAKATTKQTPKATAPQQLTDALLEALLILCNNYGISKSPRALLSGLPLTNGVLDRGTITRAAANAGLATKIADRSISSLKNSLLPVILLMRGNQAVVLKAIQDDIATIAKAKGKEERVSIEELEERFSGQVMLVVPNRRDNDKNKMFLLTVFNRFRGEWAQVILSAFLINVFGLAMPLFIMNVYDRVIPSHSFPTLWALLLGILIVFCFEFCIRLLRGYFIDIAGKGADIMITNKIFSQIQGAKLGAIKMSPASLAGEIKELENLREYFTSLSLASVIDLPFVFLFILLIAILGGNVAWVPLFAVPVILFSSFIVQRKMAQNVQDTWQDLGARHNLLLETLNNINTIKIMGAEGVQQKQWETYIGATAQNALKGRLLSSLVVNFVHLVQQLAVVLVVIAGVYQVTEGNLSVGSLIACTLLTSRTLAPLGQISGLLMRSHQGKLAWDSLTRLFQVEQERSPNGHYISLESPKGSLEFEGVRYMYPGTQSFALNGINLKIKAGEKIGIIGKNGSGKSTLGDLAVNLIQPVSGRILLDGIDIQHLDPAELRHHILLVTNNTSIFSGTLRSNLMIGNPHASDQEMLEACKAVGLMDMLNSHIQGLDMPINRGHIISSGHRQAIGLARAFLRKPRVLILDEPTNHMDISLSDKYIKPAIQDFVKRTGCTLILISHREGLFKLVDNIHVMEGGKINLSGPTDTILSKLKG